VSTGPFAAHRGGDPQARIFRRRGREAWHALGRGLPEPLPAMPYALVATEERLFAGLADGRVWQSLDRGETWEWLDLGEHPPPALVALSFAA
jgi:hypothetical protein